MNRLLWMLSALYFFPTNLFAWTNGAGTSIPAHSVLTPAFCCFCAPVLEDFSVQDTAAIGSDARAVRQAFLQAIHLYRAQDGRNIQNCERPPRNGVSKRQDHRHGRQTRQSDVRILFRLCGSRQVLSAIRETVFAVSDRRIF
jgi:hypothetical protein